MVQKPKSCIQVNFVCYHSLSPRWSTLKNAILSIMKDDDEVANRKRKIDLKQRLIGLEV